MRNLMSRPQLFKVLHRVNDTLLILKSFLAFFKQRNEPNKWWPKTRSEDLRLRNPHVAMLCNRITIDKLLETTYHFFLKNKIKIGYIEGQTSKGPKQKKQKQLISQASSPTPSRRV